MYSIAPIAFFLGIDDRSFLAKFLVTSGISAGDIVLGLLWPALRQYAVE
jgi:hypothetical protein